jgi:Lrp/AsnC family leucine-responsive transcriptional regulator
MDQLDRQIIRRLVDDGRVPYSRIAEELGVATTTVHQRVKRLKAQGVIRGTRVILDWEAVGMPVTAVVSVEYGGTDSLSTVAERMRRVPFVEACYAVTGEFDLLLAVRARSSDHLGDVLEEIRHVTPGRSRTVIVLATYFEGRVPPVSEGN